MSSPQDRLRVQATEQAIAEFVEGYECDTGEGIYKPNDHERFLIDDAISTFLSFYAALQSQVSEPVAGYTDGQLEAGIRALNGVRNALGNAASDESICGVVYDAMRAASPVASGAVTEFPAGAVHNAFALAQRVENMYDFECEAGPLRNCHEWAELLRCLWAIADYETRVAAPQQEPDEDAIRAAVVYVTETQGFDVQDDRDAELVESVAIAVVRHLAASHPQAAQPSEDWEWVFPNFEWPAELHTDSKRLVMAFAAAMAQKLAAAERKYGYGNSWTDKGWMDKCRADLISHLAKGDPRDVANYCAFLWWHNEPTAAQEPVSAEAQAIHGAMSDEQESAADLCERLRAMKLGPCNDAADFIERIAQPQTGEEIHVNAGDDVFTLPLQPSGMDSPRFVVHVPAAQPKEPTPEMCAELGRLAGVSMDAAHWLLSCVLGVNAAPAEKGGE